MSMSLLTLFQFSGTLAAYLFVTLLLPCAVLNKKMSRYRFMDRVLFYFIIGNFYATNLVFLLQLLHISNFFTLWAGLLVAPAIIWMRLNHFPFLERLRSFGHSGRKVLTGFMGIRSAADDLRRMVWRRCKRGLEKAGENVRRNWIDWLLIIALMIMLMWVYGIRMFQQFGYAMSDVPTHMYWVNGLSENHLFVSGIYPYGMHAIIYLINEMFRIDTYVVFRVFALVQCVAVHMMALLFLKLCCKSRYAAYTGLFVYVISNYITSSIIMRFLSTLPQETSMIYILPTAYYAFRFFQEKRWELKEKPPEERSKLALAGLAMSFSLCVTAHFYGAIVAVLFCVGIAVGYLGWLIRPVYFKRIIIVAFISIAIAVLPMGIAFAMGTRLENSLYWATGVVSGRVQQQERQTSDSVAQSEDIWDVESDAAASPTESPNDPSMSEPASSASQIGLWETVMRFPMDLWGISGERLEYYISRDAEEWYSVALRAMIVFLIAAGAVLLFSRERMYGAMLLSTGFFMLLMSLMFAAGGLGIPALMDESRTSMFFAYVLIIVTGFTVDVCVCAVTYMLRRQWSGDVLSFAVVIIILICIWRQGMVRSPLTADNMASAHGLETNEAVTCLTNIIATEPDYSWTIFSANDETQMVFGHGYHYELIEFLQEIETPDKDIITVPTETVYFFIEKIPMYYTLYYVGSGQPVSEEGARTAMPRANETEFYLGDNRWIVMSHMYYWAQEFQRLYPNEMKIYMETDEFICYRLEQNPYRLYDLAIDYGYNSVESEEQ